MFYVCVYVYTHTWFRVNYKTTWRFWGWSEDHITSTFWHVCNDWGQNLNFKKIILKKDPFKDEIKVATLRPMSKPLASSLHGQLKFHMVLLCTRISSWCEKKLTLFFRNSWFLDKPSHFNPVGMYWQKYEKKKNHKINYQHENVHTIKK